MRARPGFLLALLVLAAFLTGQRWAGRPDAAAIARAESLQSRLLALEFQGRQDALRDSLRADSLRVAQGEARRLRTRQAASQTRTDSFLVLVPDTALRDSLGQAITAERAVSDSLITRQQVVIGLWADRWKSAVAERDSYRDLTAELNRQLQQAVRRPQRARLRPCAFAGVGFGGPTVGAGICYSF